MSVLERQDTIDITAGTSFAGIAATAVLTISAPGACCALGAAGRRANSRCVLVPPVADRDGGAVSRFEADDSEAFGTASFEHAPSNTPSTAIEVIVFFTRYPPSDQEDDNTRLDPTIAEP